MNIISNMRSNRKIDRFSNDGKVKFIFNDSGTDKMKPIFE